MNVRRVGAVFFGIEISVDLNGVLINHVIAVSGL